METALDQAVDDCIREGVLADLLSGHKAEVMTMFLTEYDEERHMEMEREEWEAKGEAIGVAKGARALIETCQELGLSRTDAGERLQVKFSVSVDVAEEYLAAYWNADAETGTAGEACGEVCR